MIASLPKPVLDGERVTLQPLQITDIPGVSQQILLSLQDPEQNRLTGTHASFTLEQIQNFYGKAISQTDRADYKIVPNGQDQAVGEAVLNEIDWDNHAANFRIAIFDAAQHNKGFGSQATRLILGYAFETLRLHRVALEVYAFNPRAIRAYEKAGFVREGLKRDALFWDGVYVDAIVMAALASDYRNV